MYIKSLDNFLLERKMVKDKNGKEIIQYDYAIVMVKLKFKNWKDITKQFKKEDLSISDESEGIVEHPHITILYGIHLDVPDKDVENIINTIDPTKFDIKLKKPDLFVNDDFDVVKIPVSSKYLKSLNKKFSKLPNSNKYPDYKAHITLAYVKAGKGKDYTNIDLLKGTNFTDINDIFDIESIVYSKEGKKKYYFKNEIKNNEH